MAIESFNDFVDCVREGYTAHVQNWTTARISASGQKNFKVETAYQDWNRSANVAEAQHCAAIINGLFSQDESNIEKIWCAKKHNHDFIPGGVVKSTSYSSNLTEEGEWFPKDPDIAFTTIRDSLPNWFCQVKFDVQSHVKAVQALGDFFWGAVTKLVFEREKRRALEYVFVWAEHSSDRHKSKGFLRFDDAEGQMELRLSPGFTRGGYGNCQYSKLDTDNPWWNSRDAILKPNNYTTIKQMLAAGTNGTFVRMFHQPGEMRVKSEYRQLFIPTGEEEDVGWYVYVHRLMEASTYELLNSDREEELTMDKLWHWIP